MEKTEIIERIKRNLDSNYRENTDNIINEIYDDMSRIATSVSHRKNNDEELIPYIITAVKSAYLRRGKEGSSSYNEGSESDNFIDIEEKLRNDIIKNGLRRLP